MLILVKKDDRWFSRELQGASQTETGHFVTRFYFKDSSWLRNNSIIPKIPNIRNAASCPEGWWEKVCLQHIQHPKNENVFTVPGFRLPHEKPFTTNSDERHEPEQQAEDQSERAPFFFWLPLVCSLIACRPEPQWRKTQDSCTSELPTDNCRIESMVDGWRLQCSPHARVAGKGGAHWKNMSNILVIWVVVRQVVKKQQSHEIRKTQQWERFSKDGENLVVFPLACFGREGLSQEN